MSTFATGIPAGPTPQYSPSFRRQSVASLVPRKSPSGGSTSGDGYNANRSDAKIHTLTACNRCRSRKSRCDASLPKCEPCQRSGSQCDFWDASKNIKLSRSYVIFLQNRVKALEQELKQLEKDAPASSGPDEDDLVRSMGMVSLSDEEPERHFLGSSAGLQLARLVVEFAKKNTTSHSVKEIVPPTDHEPARMQGKERRPSAFALSSAPIDKLPKRELTDKLVSEFIFKRAQFMLPTLHEETFMRDADEVYAGSSDPHKNFSLKMVLAISMQKIGSQYSGLADGFYLSALTHLEAVVGAMNLSTLQCFCLMGQYSLLTPTRTGIYHIIGLATRLCIDLGLNQESTITKDIFGNPLDPLTIDMRRRLFWVTSSMESGLSHILGRPSGFCTGDTFTDVQFFLPYDDSLITKNGILAGPRSTKKLISMHFFRMRRIQSEIRLGLYQNLKETPKDDQDPWFQEMHLELDNWVKSAPGNGEGSGLSQEWFRHRYNNMLIFLYRPSPQIPKPSLDATILCYDCAIKNITIQKKMFDERSVDMTWVLVHQVYMTCIIMMWCLSYEAIRKMHPRNEVARHIQTGLDCMDMLVERWPGVGSAREIFWRLSIVALQSYDVTEASDTAGSGSDGLSPTSQAVHTRPAPPVSSPPWPPRNSSATPPHTRSPPHTPPSYSPASFHTTPPSRMTSMPSSSSIGSHHPSMDQQINGTFPNVPPILQYLNQSVDGISNHYGIMSQSPPPRMHSQSPSASSGYYGSNSPASDFNNPPTPNAHITDDITPRPSVSAGYSFEQYNITQAPVNLSNAAVAAAPIPEDIGISPQTILPGYSVGLPDLSSFQAPTTTAGSLPTISEDVPVPYVSSFPGSDQMFGFYPSSDVSNLLNWTTSGQTVDMLSGNPYASNTYRMDVIDQQQANALMMSLENDSQGDIFSGIPFSTGSYL
ncbi:hypothetical protein DRE_00268 [Drechslerella stenobrocha 248]|uniref:Zn(2)-C6 fungal-type domain-containing protein n=1 Tax=Drechslerella stenobrocha 248 TaxID=1043628 RepID=W7IA01_9PEZI|nr:hypothetical protein DRE_00268 [Drechslerella stenobrocha 248]